MPPAHSHLPGNAKIFEIRDFGPYYDGPPLFPGVINSVGPLGPLREALVPRSVPGEQVTSNDIGVP